MRFLVGVDSGGLFRCTVLIGIEGDRSARADTAWPDWSGVGQALPRCGAVMFQGFRWPDGVPAVNVGRPMHCRGGGRVALLCPRF